MADKKPETPEIEMRTFVQPVSMRQEDPSKPGQIVGYGAVIGKMSDPIMGMFREVIEPGFFDPVMGNDVRALWNHDNNYVLGRTKSGTLKLSVDDNGLRYEINPPSTQWAGDCMETIKRGDVDSSSFQFIVNEDSWEDKPADGGLPIRHLRQCAELIDVSPVTFPAYPQTSAAVRSKINQFTSQTNEQKPLVDMASTEEAQKLLETERARLDLLERKYHKEKTNEHA
jgi:HK97 family phage prohead protease